MFAIQTSSTKIFYNCVIYAVDEKNSKAEAMAVFKDKIIAIGTEQSVREGVKEYFNTYQADPEETLELEEQDLGGACIVPGFIDAHMHPGYYIYYKTQLDLSNIKNYKELENVLKKEDKDKDPEDWIFGLDLMEDLFDDPTERRFPNKNDLDLMCSNRPVVILRHDGHICSVNSVVLEKIGLNASNVKDLTPISGEIKLDSEGNPNGVFTEAATALVLDEVPMNFKGLEDACNAVSSELASFGITTCGGIIQAGERGMAGKAGALEYVLIQSLIKDDLIEQDFVFYVVIDKPKKLKRLSQSFLKLNKEENRFVIGGIKIFGDGTFGACTAYLYEPFSNSPEDSGFMVTDKETIYKIAKETAELGFQVTCHSIGDKSNRLIVDIYRDIINELKLGKSNKFRIEHASLLTDDVIKDAAKLDIIFVCQPSFINSEYTWLEGRLGPKRIKRVYPFRAIIDAGVVLVGASDAPVESASVLEAFRACVTRNNFVPEQQITIMEALKIFTYDAAYALGQEKIKGSLEIGKLADFVILDKDINLISFENQINLRILATYHRGKLIYHSD